MPESLSGLPKDVNDVRKRPTNAIHRWKTLTEEEYWSRFLRYGHWARIGFGYRGCMRRELLRAGLARPRFDGLRRTSMSLRMRVDTISDFAASNAGSIRVALRQLQEQENRAEVYRARPPKEGQAAPHFAAFFSICLIVLAADARADSGHPALAHQRLES